MRAKKHSLTNFVLLVLEKTVDGYCRFEDFLPVKFDEKDWDGKWRIVLFDIPENKRGVRDLFRRRLKEWEFQNWQKSVWVTKNNITSKLRKLISDLGIESWVAVVESNDSALHNIIFNDRGT